MARECAIASRILLPFLSLNPARPGLQRGTQFPSDSARPRVQSALVSSEQGFESLDRKVVRWWRLRGVVNSVIFVGLAGGLGPMLRKWELPWYLPAGAMLLLCLAYLLLYPPAAFRRFGYRLSPKELRIQQGVVFHSEVHVPMPRVQHVDVERGPFERLLGLARLIVFTAGTTAARQEIPGLTPDQAVALRDEIAGYLQADDKR